mmetsp:Transcript_10574/g.31170  ORF Transcript_10574/g.31170 Transcript_10574/m.31170 type:complete len:242 (+) Transcript_10574:1238-1963(+)
MVLFRGPANASTRVELRSGSEERCQIQTAALVVLTTSIDFKVLRLANHVLHIAITKLCHNLTDFFCHEEEVVHDMFGLTREFLSELFVLCCNANRACVEMAFAHHNATHRNKRSSGETKFFSTKKACNRHITTRLQLTISLKLDPMPQVVQNERLLRFSNTKFPWKASTFHTSPSSCASSTIMTTDGDVIRKCLRNASSNYTNTHFRNKFHRHLTSWLRIFQIMNELRKILDRVNIVVRWR